MVKRLAVLVLFSLAAVSVSAWRPKYPIVLPPGDTLGGTGAPPRGGDGAIKGDRVVAIGTVEGSGRNEIDATGRVVAPGFIDVQGQSGVTLLADGNGESHIRQGITTAIIG